MNDREELIALRRLAELEAKAGNVTDLPVSPDWSDLPANAPSSATKAVKGFYQMVTNPIDTATNMLKLGAGAVRNTIPQQFQSQRPEAVEASETANQFGRGMKQRYGGVENIRNTIITDPIGAAFDVTGALSLGASMLPNKAASMANKAAGMIDPLAIPRKAAKGIVDLKGRTAAGNAARLENTVIDDTLNAAHREGLVFPPTAMGKQSFLEGVAGQYKTQQAAADMNRPVINNAIRAEIGLPKGTPLTDKTFKTYMQTQGKPYQEVAGLSPQASATLEKLKEARFNKNTYWNHHTKSGDPASLVEAKNWAQQADALENSLEQQAIAAGKPDLVDSLRKARVNIAKGYTVKDSVRFASGDVNADALANAYEAGMHGIGPKLTGKLELIGKIASARRQSLAMRDFTSNPTTALDNAMFALGGAAASGSPSGLFAAGLPILRGPVRNYLLKQSTQAALRPRPTDYAVGLTPRIANGLLDIPIEKLYPALTINQGINDQNRNR